MSQVDNRPKRAPREKRPNPNWREEFYRNGIPNEVIVIEDSPTPAKSPPTSPFYLRSVQVPSETRGTKRGRKTPQTATHGYYSQQSSQPLQQHITTVPTQKRRRKG